MISVLLPTYGRPELLPEAIECFLRQTHADSELLVGNDWRGHTIHFDHPRVRVFNSGKRMSLGAKRNWLCDHARGDIVTDWDDDDIYLPGHLAHALSMMPLYRFGLFSKQRWQWHTTKGQLYRIAPAGYLHTCLMNRSARTALGGYADQTRHSDLELIGRLKAAGHLIGPGATYHKPTFVQRYNVGRERVSTGPTRAETDVERHARVDREIESRGITGEVHIVPRWNSDYSAISDASYEAVLKTGWPK